jgi:hypothetical protein
VIQRFAILILVADVAAGCASSGSPPTDTPPAASACRDLDTLRRTLRELPVRDLETGSTAALSQGLADAIDDAKALKGSAGSAIAPDVAALVASMETARVAVERSSPGPIMSDGALTEPFKSIDAVADAWLEVLTAMRSVCPAASPWPFPLPS